MKTARALGKLAWILVRHPTRAPFLIGVFYREVVKIAAPAYYEGRYGRRPTAPVLDDD